MNGFAGVVRFDGAPIDGDTEDCLKRALKRDEGAWLRRTDGALFAGDGVATAEESGGALSAALARLDNGEELRAALGVRRVDDAALLVQVLGEQGEAGLARCLGAFVFARWEPASRRLILGRDYLGINHALFLHRGRDFAAFATRLPVLLGLPFVPREIDEVALANFMVLNFRQTDHTVYRGIDRVASRTLVTLDAAGTHSSHYWSPPVDPQARRSEQDCLEEARALFDQAVVTATAGRRRIAISTSGGLDSSAIAATVARLGVVDQITCYTLTPPLRAAALPVAGWYQDETDKVRALQRMHPGLNVRLLAPEAPHPFECDGASYFTETGAPAMDPINLGWFAALHDAVSANGHELLLDGVFGNLGLTWDGKFALRALLRSGEWGRAARILPAMAKETATGPARLLASEVFAATAPASLAAITDRLRGRDPRPFARHSALSPDFVAECGLARRWRSDGFDPGFRKPGWDGATHRAWQLFDNNQHGRDVLASLHARYGFELRAPHADRRLLEFALAAPEAHYRSGGASRSFGRAVFADRLPSEILNERRRGAQGGAWFERLDMRRKDIADEIERLEASNLARRLIDLPRLKRLLDAWPADEPVAMRTWDYKTVLPRALHIGQFIRWVEAGVA